MAAGVLQSLRWVDCLSCTIQSVCVVDMLEKDPLVLLVLMHCLARSCCISLKASNWTEIDSKDEMWLLSFYKASGG